MAHSIAFDTLRFSNSLKEVGVPAKQAERQAELMAETINSELATKHDIALILKDIMWIKVFGAAFGTAILAALTILLGR